MFKEEELPPESEQSGEDEENDFINDEDDESGDDDSKSESSECKSDKSDQSETETYNNPYMERNEEMERQDIFQILSKSTEKDKSNKKRYAFMRRRL